MSSRYIRQIIFPKFGKESQEKLEQGRVLLLGCGGLGTYIANILVRAGVKSIHIMDRDFIEEHNLQRQNLFDEEDIAAGRPKAIAAAEKLKKINGGVEIKASVIDINYTNIDELTQDVDLIIDGSDNFSLRYLINDVAHQKNIPWIYGGAIGSNIMSTTILPGETPCFRCQFPESPPQELILTCDTGGILGPTVEIAASLQANEAIKILSGNKDKCNRDLLQLDIWDYSFSQLPRHKNESCECCGKGNYEFLSGEDKLQTTALCGQSAIQVSYPGAEKQDLKALAEKLEPLGEVKYAPFLLRFTAEKELAIFKDLRVIVKDCTDEREALGLYAKYIGN